MHIRSLILQDGDSNICAKGCQNVMYKCSPLCYQLEETSVNAHL